MFYNLGPELLEIMTGLDEVLSNIDEMITRPPEIKLWSIKRTNCLEVSYNV